MSRLLKSVLKHLPLAKQKHLKSERKMFLIAYSSVESNIKLEKIDLFATIKFLLGTWSLKMLVFNAS